MLDDLQPLTFERTLVRLVEMAAASGGRISAGEVEHDDELARIRLLTAAAARLLAGGATVHVEAGGADWFPFKALAFSELPSPPVEAER